MKVSSLQNSNLFTQASFRAATVNINSFSDTHGNIQLADKAYQEIKDRREDIFCREGKGKKNIFAICGDWFMDGAKKGYYSAEHKPKSFFQRDILNAFIALVKGLAPNTDFIFTPGNHEFDGGIKLADDVFANLDSDILVTNMHIETSNGFLRSISKGKILNQKIIEVEDDKNSDLKHKILLLGVSPVNLKYYQKNCQGLTLLDNVQIAQQKVEEHDYQATMSECKQRITDFKQKNPDGVVVLMSHTGVNFADNLAERAEVDFVLDGHEHKDQIRYVNKTPIIPLSQNFKKIVNLKLNFNDEGKLSSYELKSFNPTKNKKQGILTDLYNFLLSKDVEKQYTIETDKNIKELSIQNVRTGNSYLANFITDSIIEEIREEEPNVDFFGLNSSAIRGSLKVSKKPEVSHFDVLNAVSGIREEEAEIMITKMSGKEVLDIVMDNILFNSIMPKKNPIMQYAGLSVDKTAMLNGYDVGCKLESLYQYVIDTNTGKPIEKDKTYIFANTEKYFDKTDNSEIKELKQRSYKIGFTVHELFERHFENATSSLIAKCDVRYK